MIGQPCQQGRHFRHPIRRRGLRVGRSEDQRAEAPRRGGAAVGRGRVSSRRHEGRGAVPGKGEVLQGRAEAREPRRHLGCGL
jgi:hypothetical protein